VLFIQAGPDLATKSAQGANKEGILSTARRLDFDPEVGAIVGKYACTPTTIATLAALTPSDRYEVDLWDENLDGIIDADTELPGRYDLVAISLMFSYLENRLHALSALFRARGVFVAAGGPCVSSAPHRHQGLADALFIGEAERTWPRFLADWEAGEARPEYVQVEKPDLAESPVPRWGAFAARLPEYQLGVVQTTRGCPFDCEFCDVIYLFGRAQRHKPAATVLEEVRAMKAAGLTSVFFSDDEFVGNPRYTRALLRELLPLNRSFSRPLRLYTQLTINLARDEELLALAADANFYQVLIGIETFNRESLEETHKLQNVRPDLVGDLRRILSYGIGITGSFIVGFDHDGPDAFDLILDGVEKACLPAANIGLLRPFYGTGLWTRLRAEDRLVQLRTRAIPRAMQLAFMPRRMTRIELLDGLRRAADRLFDWTFIGQRIRGWADLVVRPPESGDRPMPLDRAVHMFRSGRNTMSVDDRGLRAIEETLAYVHEVAPFLLNRAVSAILTNDFSRRFRAGSDEQFARAIEAERAADFVHDRTRVALRPELAAALVRSFPAVYERLWHNVGDADLLPTAASDVFFDFVMRWGEERVEADERLLGYLLELCDRVSAQTTGQSPISFPRRRDGNPPLAAVKRSRLAEAVMKDVQDRVHKSAPEAVQAGAARPT
jgi:radical SAM superfamily enzyme YgiQ (UPF0313 family)